MSHKFWAIGEWFSVGSNDMEKSKLIQVLLNSDLVREEIMRQVYERIKHEAIYGRQPPEGGDIQ